MTPPTLTKSQSVAAIIFLLLGAGLAIAGLIAGATLINAFVLRQLWGWFVCPAFGLAPLSLAQSVGLISVAYAVQFKHRAFEKEDESAADKWGQALGSMLGYPALLLLIGYVAHRAL